MNTKPPKPYIMTILINGEIFHTPECKHGLPTFVCPKCMAELNLIDEIQNAEIEFRVEEE